MESLSDLDPVAYIRFTSIYKDFSNPRDFEEFVSHLKKGGPLKKAKETEELS